MIRIPIYLSPELYKELKQEAHLSKISISGLVRKIIEDVYKYEKKTGT